METTRRRFLGGIAVASALTTAANAQAVTYADEDAALITAGEKFEAAHAKFLATDAAMSPYQDAYLAIAPSGEGLVFTRIPSVLRYASNTVPNPIDPRYRPWKSDAGEFFYVVRSDALERQIDGGHILDTTSSRELVEKARQYEADTDAARQASGLDKAFETWHWAQSDLMKAVQNLCDLRARTPHGVALKIRATAAYASLGTDERFRAAQWLSKAVWEDMGEDA